MKWLYERLVVWYWTRYYKKRMTEEPDSPEMLEAATRFGRIVDYKKWLETRK